MKATGIVRRIDDLGRVVIPKEIRRTMRIRDGDPLEIYTDRQGGVIFKKYSPMGDLGEIATSLCESMNKTSGKDCFICDREMITAGDKNLYEKNISPELSKIMFERKIYQSDSPNTEITLGSNIYVSIAAPIITEGDVSGCVVFTSNQKNTKPLDSDIALAKLSAGFLSKQMES